MRRRLKQRLSSNFSPDELGRVYSSFDVIGDIAIIRAADDAFGRAELLAKQIMGIHKNVKTVLAQMSPILGDFRVRELKLVAGEDKTTTKYKESGCVFAVDVAQCYFSPRLSYERRRLAHLVKPDEIVVNMFAGVGCFSMIIAKAVRCKVYSIDVNPVAVKYMEENVKVNRVSDKVTPLQGDSKDVVYARLRHVADRVLMPLPEKALEYLPSAVSALKQSGGWLHMYDFQHAYAQEDPIDKTRQKAAEKLSGLEVDYSFIFSRVVRSIGPNWYQTVLDIRVDF